MKELVVVVNRIKDDDFCVPRRSSARDVRRFPTSMNRLYSGGGGAVIDNIECTEAINEARGGRVRSPIPRLVPRVDKLSSPRGGAVETEDFTLGPRGNATRI